MSLQSPNTSYAAGGNIEPSVFLAGGSADNTVVQANASSIVVGVSTMGTRAFPDTQNSGTQYAAIAGGTIGTYELSDYCYIKLGAGGCSAWSKLKPDASGYAVAATTTGDKYFAIAREAAAAGEYVFAQLIGIATV